MEMPKTENVSEMREAAIRGVREMLAEGGWDRALITFAVSLIGESFDLGYKAAKLEEAGWK